MVCAFINALFVASVSLLLHHNAHGFPTGPPPSVCGSLSPLGHLRAGRSQNLNYVISAPDSFSPGEEVTIRIGGNDQLKGLIMQVRLQARPSGRFGDLPDGFKIIGCRQGSPDSTVGHSNGRDKNAAESAFTWTAPDVCSGGGIYVIRATVVQSFSTFQESLMKEMICRPKPVIMPPTTESTMAPTTESTMAPTTESTMAPISKVPAGSIFLPCEHLNVTRVPSGKYTTSFEEGEGLNGWIDQRGWRQNSGSTPTPGTGPDSAANGDNYLYYEANVGAGDSRRALLISRKDLRGCFCLSLKQNHNVRDNTGHRFLVTVAGNPIFRTMRGQEGWRQLKFQIDFPSFVQVRIIERRGRNIFGDSAIDDIRVEPGRCREVEPEEEDE